MLHVTEIHIGYILDKQSAAEFDLPRLGYTILYDTMRTKSLKV